MTEPAATAPADAVRGSWVERAPVFARPYLQLSRYDRPVGFWLLGLPCLIGLALMRAPADFVPNDAWLAALFIIGAVAMRGAGCTYNDILDRDIDGEVARTALRPLPSGAVTLKQAWAWLLVQCLVGLGVLLCLPDFAKLIALASIPMVALYPLMKRITWWPQVWLGLTFNWGALVAAAATRGAITQADAILYVALVFWTLGYDTIYAIQDREDDALIGVKSTARRFGDQIRPAVAAIYALCAIFLGFAGYFAAGWMGAAAVIPFAGHLAQQAIRLDPANGELALNLFRANRDAGVLLFLSWAFIALLNSRYSRSLGQRFRENAMADTPAKGAGLAIGAAVATGVAAVGLAAFLLTQGAPPAPAYAPETANEAPVASAALGADSTTVQPAQFGQVDPATPPLPPTLGTDATATSPDGGAVSFSDESLSFSASIPRGAANDPVLIYLRRDSQAYLNKMKTNARADYDRLKRTGAKPDPWEVRVKWAYTAKAGDIVSLAGEASEYNGGAHPMQYFDTHIARTSGDQLKMSDILLAKASPSPAITIAICEALKTAKQARVKAATIFDEPIVCVGSSANAKTEEAKIALAPSNQPGKFGGLYVYYDPYVVGAYSEGGYRLTVQQEVLAEDLRPQFKALFGGEAPPLAN